VTILILEHACLFHASITKPTIKEALHKAYSQYQALNTQYVITQFLASPKEYSIIQITEFILNHRLS
jgi:hypothetical protein